MSASDYYPLITAAARATGLPWWLIYCQIEQESGFDPNSESSCGALGLLQLMPSSFPAFGRSQLLDPATNVKLGGEFLRELVLIWKQEAPDEALKFGLACYNCGSGYVLAAQKLAQAAGLAGNTWDGIAPFLAKAEVNGKVPDVEQVTQYVARIWANYQARIEQEPPA